ncbi:putative transcriptional regulator, TetR family protein [Microlunatus endophyticus]|uniref:Transcriptional regulator, TetR family protein n=1 Tax=Microlunatus endophyticus TaxID=1716077 RepID=A0A917W2K6_9ACTN|nr:TetR/AcrR family transcriptional regulator [Microlunatus endophyticus]GGL54467.1 putative transcriptional regulator, TetR family protein [Microlunatus endophyticus]
MTTNQAPGRPRSQAARTAVLHAVDDLLLEQGYAAMTMKGIAERAGVGRQTVYRWWSTKAEILIEATVTDALDELVAPVRRTPRAELTSFLQLLVRFLTVSPAGLAYRALLGQAQHDEEVAGLLVATDPLAESARIVLDRVRPGLGGMPETGEAVAELVGPIGYAILARSATGLDTMIERQVDGLLASWGT